MILHDIYFVLWKYYAIIENVSVCMKGDLFMASKKQEIRKQIKKKEAKEIEQWD